MQESSHERDTGPGWVRGRSEPATSLTVLWSVGGFIGCQILITCSYFADFTAY